MLSFNRSTRNLVLIIITLVGLGLLIAYVYYSHLNKSEDPRVTEAREMLLQYEDMMKQANFLEAIPILDSVEKIYQHTRGYEGSFEFGVIYNNKASVYIMKALYDSLISPVEKEKLLGWAKYNLDKSIGCYQSWLDSVKDYTEDSIREIMMPIYFSDDNSLAKISPKDVMDKRIKDIMFAKVETKRRLSVAYTNLGIVQRHLLMQDSAIYSYAKALELWDDNFQAKSNLQVLMGEEPTKSNFIQKLFPPDRKSEE